MRSRSWGSGAVVLLCAPLVGGCGDPGSASFSRTGGVATNNASKPTWTSDDIRHLDPSTLKVTFDGAPSVTVVVHLAKTPSASGCARTFREDRTLDLGGADTCSPELTYSEDLEDCDGCDLGGAIADAIFGALQAWKSTRGTIKIAHDPEEDVSLVAIQAHVAPGGGSLGGNTAKGEFELKGSIRITDFEVE